MKKKSSKKELDIIVENLRKYPFTEKMLICQLGSMRLMEITHLDILNTPNAIYPWELEVLAELSLFADAPVATCSFSESEEKLIEIVNRIRNYQPPVLKNKKNMDFVNAFMMATSLQQFKLQENIFDRLYRYEFFWHYISKAINMPEIFSTMFEGAKYDDFRDLAILIFFYASLEQPTADIMRALCFKYHKIVKQLKITRNEYQQRQSEKIDENFENVVFGFNYLKPYPFVEFEECLFLPLPFLIIDAVTDSLLTRATDGNNSLRETIGKDVAQAYIQKIYNEGNIYDEVLPECFYYKGRNRIDSPDVMIRLGSQVCFIDSKLSTPGLAIRQFNDEVIENTIDRYAKNIIQIYNRVNDFNSGLFYPFQKHIQIDKSDVFGIVALFEDAYISKRQIYQQVFLKLGVAEDSREAEYIKSNIKITSFRDLELFAFRSHNIFVALSKKRDNPQDWNDIGLFVQELYKNDNHVLLPALDDFIKQSKKVVHDSIEELSATGLIKRDGR